MLKDIYLRMNHLAFWVCLIISIGLSIGSFFVPPMGIIDGSVLAIVGEMFAFAALATVIAALGKGSDVTISHGKTNVTVNAPDGE